MPSTTESSAIVRFIRQAQPPILERQHGIETEVVQSPYYVPAKEDDREPARRSYAPLLALVLGAAAVAAALILYLYASSGEVGQAQASAPPAPIAVAEAIAAPAPAPEPIVIAVRADSPEEAAPEEAAPEDPATEPVEVIDPDARPAPDRSDHERTPARRPAATHRSRAKPRTEVPVLAATKGILMIASKPPCHIIIDGEETGLTTPQPMIRLKTGRHQVTLVNLEYDIRATLPVVIEAGKSVRVVKDLTDRMKRDAP